MTDHVWRIVAADVMPAFGECRKRHRPCLPRQSIDPGESNHRFVVCAEPDTLRFTVFPLDAEPTRTPIEARRKAEAQHGRFTGAHNQRMGQCAPILVVAEIPERIARLAVGRGGKPHGGQQGPPRVVGDPGSSTGYIPPLRCDGCSTGQPIEQVRVGRAAPGFLVA